MELEIQGSFNLERTVLSHGWYQIPPFAWDKGLFSLAYRPAAGGPPARLDVRSLGPHRLAVEMRGPSDEEGEALALVSRVFNLDQDLGPFHRACAGYPPLAWVVEEGAGRILRGLSVHDDVVASICGTNIAWKQAVRAIGRLAEVAPLAPGGLRAFPTAQEILDAGQSHLIDRARLGYRARFILAFCSLVAQGQVDLSLPYRREPDGPAVRAFFRSFPGIGPITARYLATLYNRCDELAVDSLVSRYIGDKYHGGVRATEQQVLERYRPFGPHMALAYWFEFLGDVDPVTWRSRGSS